jgi:hypothetical protein
VNPLSIDKWEYAQNYIGSKDLRLLLLFCSRCNILVCLERGPERAGNADHTVENMMFNWLDNIPYNLLIFIAIFMLLAPFRPMPHLVEKLIMLKNGTLSRPIDIFDLFFHLAPTVLLIAKIVRDVSR